MKITIRRKGGPGSGNWGHKGRPGMVGGSSTSMVAASATQSEELISAIQSYTGSGNPLNNYLRNGRELDSNQRATVEALDAGMQPLSKNVVVYRGMPQIRSAEQAKKIYGTTGRLEEGLEFSDAGFTSTSHSLDSAYRFSKGKEGINGDVWRIHLKRGQHALDVSSNPNFVEHELILPRNTTYRIIGRKYDMKNDIFFIDLEVVE